MKLALICVLFISACLCVSGQDCRSSGTQHFDLDSLSQINLEGFEGVSVRINYAQDNANRVSIVYKADSFSPSFSGQVSGSILSLTGDGQASSGSSLSSLVCIPVLLMSFLCVFSSRHALLAALILSLAGMTLVLAACPPTLEISLPPSTPAVWTNNGGSSRVLLNKASVGILYGANTIAEGEDDSIFLQQMTTATSLAIDEFSSYSDILFIKPSATDGDLLTWTAELYGRGVRMFIGPLTSAEATDVLEWADSANANDATFLSPSSTADSLSDYPNYGSLVVSNIGRAAGYIKLIRDISQEAIDEAGGAQLLSLLRDDESSRELWELISTAYFDDRMDFKDPVFFDPTQITSTAAAKVVLQLLLTQSQQVPSTVPCYILVSAHDEIRYLIDALKDSTFSSLLNREWVGVGFDYNPYVQNSDLRTTASRIMLHSLIFQGANLAADYKRRDAFFDSVRESLSLDTDVNVHPLVATCYDAVLLSIDPGPTFSDSESAFREIYDAAEFEYGLSGHLQLNEDRQRIRGSYNWVVVSDEWGWESYGQTVLTGESDDETRSLTRTAPRDIISSVGGIETRSTAAGMFYITGSSIQTKCTTAATVKSISKNGIKNYNYNELVQGVSFPTSQPLILTINCPLKTPIGGKTQYQLQFSCQSKNAASGVFSTCSTQVTSSSRAIVKIQSQTIVVGSFHCEKYISLPMAERPQPCQNDNGKLDMCKIDRFFC